MPHLWMFLLQSLTPPEHEVLLIDGNTQPMSDADVVLFVLGHQIGLVGIGAMTRMVAKAYRVADAIRAAGVPVVMGGPHVTEVPGEALGRDGGPRHADSVALGEADETWPRIVEDAAAGRLKEIYTSVDAFGQERKPDLQKYTEILANPSISHGSNGFPASSGRSWRTVISPGKPPTLFRLNPGAALHTAAFAW
jgi:radical SAM superfamily enzyme YgiQ (UPF0313 family)